MSWEKVLTKGFPIAVRVLREVVAALADGADNDEVRRRVAKPGVILDEALDQLRDDEDDLMDYIRSGR